MVCLQATPLVPAAAQGTTTCACCVSNTVPTSIDGLTAPAPQPTLGKQGAPLCIIHVSTFNCWFLFLTTVAYRRVPFCWHTAQKLMHCRCPGGPGQTETVRLLLQETKMHVDATRDGAGPTALFVAAQSGHIMTCRLLLERGASVNVRCGPESGTPLFAAASLGHWAICRLLVDCGADVRATDGDGLSALFVVTDTETCRFLLSAGADVNQQLPDGCTPLIAASRAGLCEIGQCLLHAGAEVHHRMLLTQQTALHCAATRGALSTCKALLEAGAAVEAVDATGSTPCVPRPQ